MSKKQSADQSFNAIAKKFEKNIYGSTKGKLRHHMLKHFMKKYIDLQKGSLTVLDAGGGTGEMSRDLAELGHQVTLNDLSEECILLAKSKLEMFENIQFNQQPIQAIDNTKMYDLVVCHAVLEWLNKPLQAVEHLLSCVRPGGHLSLSFFNLDAHRFGNLLYGNFDYVDGGMVNKNTVRLNPKNALSPHFVLDFLDTQNVDIVSRAGIRCFHDYLRNPDMQISHYDQLLAMEVRYAEQLPYLWLGKYFHVIIKKPAA